MPTEEELKRLRRLVEALSWLVTITAALVVGVIAGLLVALWAKLHEVLRSRARCYSSSFVTL